MGLPATDSSASVPVVGVGGSVALAQTVPADVATADVTAPMAADVRFERPALSITLADGHAPSNGHATAHAAADVVKTSRALTRTAEYKQDVARQQAAARKAAEARASHSASRSNQRNDQRPPKRASLPLSDASCSISPAIVSNLTSNARSVYRAVCAAFGRSVSSFGGYRAGDPRDHGSGVDIMVSGQPGRDIARYVQAHARELHVTYVIYEQKIWLVGKPTSQWRTMEDRGSRTANHYDHVHVSVS
jgi:hypothetical protein